MFYCVSNNERRRWRKKHHRNRLKNVHVRAQLIKPSTRPRSFCFKDNWYEPREKMILFSGSVVWKAIKDTSVQRRLETMPLSMPYVSINVNIYVNVLWMALITRLLIGFYVCLFYFRIIIIIIKKRNKAFYPWIYIFVVLNLSWVNRWCARTNLVSSWIKQHSCVLCRDCQSPCYSPLSAMLLNFPINSPATITVGSA